MRFPIPLRASAAAALFASVLVGCDSADQTRMNGETPDTVTAEGLDASVYLAEAVDRILIRIEGCAAETDSVTILVDPWEAHVLLREPFGWDIEGDVEGIRVVHRAGQPALPELAEAAPGGSIEVPGLVGAAGDRTRYNILAQCGARVIVIDPDIVLREPW